MKFGTVYLDGKIVPIAQGIDGKAINLEKDEKYGFIDSSGKEIVKPIYDRIFDFGSTGLSNYAKYVKGNKEGLIDSNGKEVVFSSANRKK